MIEAIIFKGLKNYKETIYFLRNLVVPECWQLNSGNFIAEDIDAYHVLVYEGERAIATGRLRLRNKAVREANIEAVAVVEDQRSMYVGDLVVKMLLDQAFSLSYETVFVEAVIGNIIFFEKIGFKKTNDINEEGFYLLKIKQNEIKKCH